MYLDLEDYRPDTPRVPTAISVREGVLLSLVAHLCFVIFILVAPSEWFEPTAQPVLPVPVSKEPLRFVQMAPAIDRAELARRLAEQSDMDRRSTTRERAPAPNNPAPFSRGNTPEKVVGAPEARARGPETPAPAEPSIAEPVPNELPTIRPEAPVPAPRVASGTLGQSLKNLQRYLENQNYDNVTGGATDQSSADIQFDSKGVDFGPWLRRFVAQIKRNWLIPQVAELAKGRVVVQFTVLRNGTIVELRVAQPASIDALTISALNALKLSNPTTALPAEFPDERAPFVVTFHYNENIRESP
jgi:TonB family protein